MRKYIGMLIVSCLLSACDSLLDVESDEKMDGSTFWTEGSLADMEAYVSGLYYFFRDATMKESAFIEFSGDIRCAPLKAYNSSDMGRCVNFLTTNDLNGLRNKFSGDKDWRADGIMDWQTFYKVVQEANFLLENIKNVPNLDATDVERLKAEAIFMRCLCYFFLVRNFGDVPYYENAGNQESLPRTDMVIVLQSVRNNLQRLLDNDPDASILPWTYTSASKKAIRASRGSVLALLMHVNMWLAGFDKDTDPMVYYQSAADCGAELVDNNGGAYSLLPIEQSSTIFSGSSNEGIFEIAQNLNYGMDETFRNEAIFSNLVVYDCLNKNNPEAYFDPEAIMKIYPSTTEDDRVTYWFDEDIYNTSETARREMVKFLNEDTNEDNVLTSNSGNQIIFRFADAVLLYAEALAELGTDDAKALELLNRIRSRAHAPEVMASGDNLKDAIYWERVRELIGEGQYFYDLVRTGKLCDRNYCFNPIRRSDFNEGAWTWPISQSAFENNTYMSSNIYWE